MPKKKLGEERFPASKDPFSNFVTVLLLQAEHFGVRSDRNVAHHINLLVEACQQRIVRSKKSTRKRKITETRKFILMFTNRYLQLTDFEYSGRITDVQYKSVEATARQLGEIGSSVEEYMEWLFGEFLPSNDEFCPPSISHACSKYIFSNFRYVMKEKLKKRHDGEQRKLQEDETVRRGQVLMSKGVEGVKGWFDAYDRARISMVELLEKITAAEDGLAGLEGEVT